MIQFPAKPKLVLLTVLLLFNINLAAQNYECVNSGRFSLFSNGWELQAIEIETELIALGGEIFRENYSSVEITLENAMILDGNPWIGPNVISANGWNHFFNFEGDSIHLKPNASVNESWEFYRFGQSKYVLAEVVSIEQASFIGITDSVKTIAFTTMSNGQAVPEWIDSVQVQISKNNGLIETINFYEFPVFYSNSISTFGLDEHYNELVNFQSAPTAYQLIGLNTNSSYYGTGLMTPTDIFNIPENHRFAQVHSVTEYHEEGLGGWWRTFFDHYTFNHDLVDGVSNISTHTCFFNDWEEYTDSNNIHLTSNGTLDTMPVISNIDGNWFDGRPFEYFEETGDFEVTLRNINVFGREVLTVIDSLENTGGDTLAFRADVSMRGYVEGIGQSLDFYSYTEGNGPDSIYEDDFWRLVYYRVNNEIWSKNGYVYDDSCISAYVPDIFVGVDEDHIIKGFSVFPNPSNGNLTIDATRPDRLFVFTLQGKLLFEQEVLVGRTDISISEPGIYLIKGKYGMRKVVVLR